MATVVNGLRGEREGTDATHDTHEQGHEGVV